MARELKPTLVRVEVNGKWNQGIVILILFKFVLLICADSIKGKDSFVMFLRPLLILWFSEFMGKIMLTSLLNSHFRCRSCLNYLFVTSNGYINDKILKEPHGAGIVTSKNKNASSLINLFNQIFKCIIISRNII